MRRAFHNGLLLLTLANTTWTQQSRTHNLALTPEHVHWGYYDSRLPPGCGLSPAIAFGWRRWSRADCSESDWPESPSLRFRNH